MLKSDDGSILKKWTWPKYGGKLRENVIFHVSGQQNLYLVSVYNTVLSTCVQLNKEMYVRIIARDNAILHFSCNREATKLHVGAASKDLYSPLSAENQVTRLLYSM